MGTTNTESGLTRVTDVARKGVSENTYLPVDNPPESLIHEYPPRNRALRALNDPATIEARRISTAQACERLFDLMAMEPEDGRRHMTRDPHEQMMATYAATFGWHPTEEST